MTRSMRSPDINRKFRSDRQAGWSLIELLVAIGIFMLLLMISYMPFKLTRMAMAQNTAHAEMMHRTRMEMQRLMHDLRSGRSVTPSNLSGSTYSTIDFDYLNPFGQNTHVKYTLQGTALMRSDTVNGTTQTRAVLPEGVAAFWVQPQQTIGTSQTLTANPPSLPSLPTQQVWTPSTSGVVNKATADPFDCGVLWVYAKVSTNADESNATTGWRRDNDLRHETERLPTSYVEFGSAVLLRNP